jgi:2,4-dienoyl-CoA reductase-like NADH-dependent reductase (Old Yellow Enzyme family)
MEGFGVAWKWFNLKRRTGRMMSENTAFSKLFESTKIGSMHLKNRIIMPAMSTTLANKEGLVTDAMKGYYEARARGGVGMVIVENASVDFPQGRHRLLGLARGRCRVCLISPV